MRCAACQSEAGPGQRFCGYCGQSLMVPCPRCGQENPGDHRFCGGCGGQLGPEAASPAPAEAPTVTERRVVSVLFVDLVGFTTLSQHRDPEEVRELVTRYFEMAQEVIARFGGTVDKYIGDAVMAWWGATTSNEDDAERAVRAGLELVDRVTTLELPDGPELAARAGVMTGEVSVGPGGNERGLLLGDLVNSTSRLQSIAEPGTVYVGETTAALVEKAIELLPAGSHQVKGKDQPIVAARAVRVLSERGGKGRADVFEPPFVGRVSELRLLKDSLHDTGRERRARLVSLVGQAGIGKSRLIWEFQKYVDGLVEDVYWHQGRSPAYGDGLALWALGEMIRRRAGIQETDPDDVTALRLAEAVAWHVEDPANAEWVRERLSGLLGVGDSGGTERNELFAAARAFFEGISAKGTTVLIFEDLHWADPSLLQFIEELPDWSQGHPILVITVARPDLLDRRPDWGSGRRGFSSVYLGPLSDGEMAELIAGAVPGIPDHAVDSIVATAGGVPLFAVEMLRTLLGDGRLRVVDDGTVTVAGDLERLEVPDSVQAVISARLDRLPPEEREVSRDAAVLGQSFTIEALAALRGEEPDKLERRLVDMVRHEVLELVHDPQSPERGQYRWVQSLLREVAYGRISRGDRHDLHLRAARYFGGLDDPELAPIAAAHYLASWEQATAPDPDLETEVVGALRAAIDRSQAIHAHEQILSLVDASLPVVPPDVEVELREIGALAAVRLDDTETADLHTGALMELAENSEDVSLTHRAIALFGRVANDTRRSDRALQVLSGHLEGHRDLRSDPNLARAAVYLARAHMLMGDPEAAAAIADDALGAVEHLGLIEEVADAMVTRGTALSHERAHQGMALLRGALRICREHDLLSTKLRTLMNIGYASPEMAETLEATREAFEEAKRVGDRNFVNFVAGNLGGQYLFLMDLDAAEELLADPVLGDSPAARLGRLLGEAEVLFRRGDAAGATERIAQAKALASGFTDAQSHLAVERVEATAAIFALEPDIVFEIGARRLWETTFAPPVSAYIALTGAAMAGDEAMLEEARAMASSLPPQFSTTSAVEWATALLTLLGGEVERAIQVTDELVSRIGAMGMLWTEFLVLATMAHHLPADSHHRERYLDRGHQIAEEAGAAGLTEWLDRLVATPA